MSGVELEEDSLSAPGDEEAGATVGEVTPEAAEDVGVVVAPDRGGTSAVRALTIFKSPNPHSLSRPGGPISSAVAVRRLITSGPES